jgi:hypothetical protein
MRPDIEKLKATIRGFLNVTGYPSPEVINDILYEDIPNLVRYIEELEAAGHKLLDRCKIIEKTYKIDFPIDLRGPDYLSLTELLKKNPG